MGDVQVDGSLTNTPTQLLSASTQSLLVAKLYIWNCRRIQEIPDINRFKSMAHLKYETELFIGRHGNKKETFSARNYRSTSF